MHDLQHVTDEKLISLACNMSNWLNEKILFEIGRRADENNVFFDVLCDVVNREGLDSVKLCEAIGASRLNQGKAIPDLQTGETVEEQEAEWLITDLIPRYQITTLAGDGGSGKTSIECAITASITTGEKSFMHPENLPVDYTADPENVLFLSAEDDFSRVLKRKLRIAGADLKRVFTLPISSDLFPKVKFASPELRQLIEACNPGLVIFDPIQAFVPPDIQMGWRNAMRQCLNPLVGYGEEYGASFLIICHTNKQSGLSGRKRIAESADIWDISRSVLMVGDTGEGNVKYMSHEKSNYGLLQQTILYTLDGEKVIYKGRSDLRDADYVRHDRVPRPAPARDEAKDMLIETLKKNGGEMNSDDLDRALKSQGISQGTLNRAKTELKQERIIKYSKPGFGMAEWKTSLVQVSGD